ncbi:peptidoglycan/LPS O-acetylase OafA/YrhL [Pseudomonas duriflava]|uniref:Peptidoglycan/LPS O-acetylase OafA/YrhL n=1 Tax=Pseudomonas duriflava TaxID=459528 RepID=A0A562PKU0_9PSED|nr:acyltransferase [Pseudomonas duriflava]TWI45039.1 peptidoglycan/LPS O-acetylase OafA/YrhL [Pseudomonas duriflava]
MKPGNLAYPKRIYSLDVLRGIAALVVVFWHWQHFFYEADHPKDFRVSDQPFYDLIPFAYQRGNIAVELFFCISGFVFFWLFSKAIASREISVKAFLIDRISRLYPLHLATFGLVALLQMVYVQSNSSFFIYQANDAYHALLNLLLMPAWGVEKGWSFNAPIWSVSVEFMLYGVFFIICLLGSFRYLAVPALILFGWFIYPDNYKLGSGFYSFFSGAFAFVLFHTVREWKGALVTTAASVVVFALASLIAITIGLNSYFFLTGVIFPSAIVCLAAVGCMYPSFLRPFGFVGDISYSSYLLHFPLQIVFALLAQKLDLTKDVFYSPWALVLFMLILIPLSYAGHVAFERPVQTLIRGWFRTPQRIQDVALKP